MPDNPNEMTIRVTLPLVPHLEQYFGPWAMEETAFRALFDQVARMDLAAHVREAQARQGDEEPGAGEAEKDPLYSVSPTGIATIQISGVMSKYGSSLSARGSTIRTRQALRKAVADSAAQGIMLLIESPGGTAAGTDELGDEVWAAAQAKPLTAYILDMGASAAYWAASQGSRVVANAAAWVGSIGSYLVVADDSQAAEKDGVKVHVIRSAKFKGVAVGGTKITDEQLDDIQRLVNTHGDLFVSKVMRGRRMDAKAVAKIADGRVHDAPGAMSLGLIDAVESFDDAMAELEQRAAGDVSRGDDAGITGTTASAEAGTHRSEIMSGEQKTEKGAPADQGGDESKVASIAALKAALPKSDAEFREECQEKGLTVEAAQAAWGEHEMTRLTTENAAQAETITGLQSKLTEVEAANEMADAEITKLKAAMATAGADGVGHKPEESAAAGGATGGGDRTAVIAQARKEYAGFCAAGKMPCSEADHVNTTLRDANGGKPAPLSADESRTLGISTEA